MNIASLIQREIVSIDEQATLVEAARLMRAQHVGALVVTRQGERGAQAIGVLSDRDLAVEALARELAPATQAVGPLAHRRLVAVPGGAGVSEALAAMRESGVRRLLVTGEQGELVGLVAIEDIVDTLAAQWSELAQALRAGIEREAAERGPIEPPQARRPVFLAQGTPGMPWPKSL